MTLFNELNAINVNNQLEKKNGLSYLSWSWAHAQLKKIDPDYKVEIKEFPYPNATNENFFVPYLKTDEGYFVQVSVTVKGKTETEWLPVLDFKNKPVAIGSLAAFDINKAHKRCFVKAAALHGLGLYVYNGEDLPESEKVASEKEVQELLKKIKQLADLSNGKATAESLLEWLKIEDVNFIDKQLYPKYMALVEKQIQAHSKKE